MQKWEYLALPIKVKAELILPAKKGKFFSSGKLQLTYVGQDGWELVSVDNGIAYFKRPIVDPNTNKRGGFWPNESS